MCKKLMFLVSLIVLLGLTQSASAVALVTETFDSDLGKWADLAYQNTDGDNNFGWSNTNNAGGASAGEAGGTFGRHTWAYIGDEFDEELTSADTIRMRGSAKMINNTANGHVFIGFFYYDSGNPSGGGPKLGIDITEPDQPGLPWRLYLSINGVRDQPPQVTVANNTVWTFDLTYENGTFSGTIAGQSVSRSVALSGTINAMGMGSYHTSTRAGDYGYYYVDDVEYTTPAPPVPTIQFESAASGDLETVSPAVIEVTLSEAVGEAVTVDYAATGGTATGGGVDYTLTPGTLTFNAGETVKNIEITIIDDGLDEDDETIEVTLSNVTGGQAELGSPAQHTYTIIDPRVSVRFDAESSSSSEDLSPVNIIVRLSFASTDTVMVDYAVTGGTATGGGVDYTLDPGTLTFSPGDTSESISIAVVDDGMTENDETIEITLSNPVNARLSIPSEHTLTIQDPGTSEGTQAVDLKIDIGACGQRLGEPVDAPCDPSGSYQVVKEGFTDWTQWDPDLPGGEACVDWYERKTKVIGDITMVLERFGPCEDEGDYGAGLRFKNSWAGPLTGDGVNVNNMPNEDDPNPCGGAPELKLTITGIPEVASYNYQMTSWHNNIEGGACAVGGVTITVNGSQVVSNLAQTTEKVDDDAAAKATYEVPGGPLELHFIASKHNVFINGFRITDGAGASNPTPADGAVNIEPDVTLGWTPGQYANTHRVYLGTNPDALQFQGHITETSFQPAELLDLGTTYYWRIDEVNGAYPESPWRGPVWSFTTAGAKARDPDPADGESDVDPIPTLSWTPAPPAASHDVYLGTDETAVANATTFSTEFQDNVEPNSFEPGLLDFGRTYYWRIDEVNDAEPASPWIGDVWAFTVHNGKASDPNPPDGSKTPTPYVVLGWTAAPLTDSHDVYFGTTEAAVADATTGSSEYKGNRTSTSYDPRPLSEGVTYYWRIDEVGTTTRKGDVWSFTAVAPVNMQVDFVPEVWGNETQAIPGTHKPGWIPFMPGGWGDLYMHDWRGITNLGGTGVDVCITGCAEGRSGMKVYGMCMDNKAGGAAPNGSPVGEPIANSWFTSVDRCAGPLGVEGSSQLGIYKLPAGTYEVKMYHNLWEPSSDSSRECTNDAYGNRSPMDVHVRSFAEQWAWCDTLCAVSLYHCGHAGDALRKMQGFAGPDPGNNVVAIQEAFGVLPTSVQTDADVATSLVKFWTDGSPVILHCQTGEEQDSQYRGDRAAINAFEIRSIAGVEQPPACWDQTQCYGDSDNDGQVKGSDFLALKASWYKCHPDPDYDPCADFDRDGCVKGSDFLILKSNWYQTVSDDCTPGGTWPPQL